MVRQVRKVFDPPWPGLSRPSTFCLVMKKKDVDAPHEAVHDGALNLVP